MVRFDPRGRRLAAGIRGQLRHEGVQPHDPSLQLRVPGLRLDDAPLQRRDLGVNGSAVVGHEAMIAYLGLDPFGLCRGRDDT